MVKHFEFLVAEFGYVLRLPSDEPLGMVHYEKLPVTIDIGWYKGEVSVLITVTVNTAMLRPGKSKQFYLDEIVGYLDKSAFKDIPKFPGYVTTDPQADEMLAFEARLLKTYGESFLRGDLKVLETIAQKRN